VVSNWCKTVKSNFQQIFINFKCSKCSKIPINNWQRKIFLKHFGNPQNSHHIAASNAQNLMGISKASSNFVNFKLENFFN
jgi:hypothetical protein